MTSHIIKQKNKHDKKCEYISKDILEEQFVNVFKYFFYFQEIGGWNRVKARARFITPITVSHKIYTIITSCATFFLFTYMYVQFIISYVPAEQINYTFYICYFLMTLNYFGVIINSRFVHNQRIVNFFITMQKNDRLMRIQHNKAINEMLRRYVNLGLAIPLTFYILLIFGAFYVGLASELVPISFILLPSIVDIIQTSDLLVYFCIRLRFINSILQNHIQGRDLVKNTSNLKWPSKPAIRYLAAQTHDLRYTNVDEHLRRLFTCFTDFQDLHQFAILIHIFCLFMYSLNVVQYIVLGLRANYFSYIDGIGVLSAVGIYFLQSFVLMILLEKIFREVRDIKNKAVALMALSLEGAVREKVKRIYSLTRDLPLRFSVFDMWNMNAMFYVNFFAILSTATITLLQFDFQ